MKLIMLCGVPCDDREMCLQQQKKSLDDFVVIDDQTEDIEIEKSILSGKNIIWNQLNLYPEIREKRLSIIPDGYHKTAIYFKPSAEEIERRDVRSLNMQFVSPTEFENFDCIMRYM